MEEMDNSPSSLDLSPLLEGDRVDLPSTGTLQPGRTNGGRSPVERRVCGLDKCTRRLGNVLLDPHTVCVECRGLCEPSRRCKECLSWENDKVLTAFQYQSKLKRC